MRIHPRVRSVLKVMILVILPTKRVMREDPLVNHKVKVFLLVLHKLIKIRESSLLHYMIKILHLGDLKELGSPHLNGREMNSSMEIKSHLIPLKIIIPLTMSKTTIRLL